MALSNSEIWSQHYTRAKSQLAFPDENLVRLLAKVKPAQGPLVDLGCGSGRHLPLLKQYSDMVIGLDYVPLNDTPLAHAAQTMQVTLIQSRGQTLPFADLSIRGIVAWGSLHYGSFSEMREALDEIKRVLCPQGRLWGTFRASSDSYLPRGEQTGPKQWQIRTGDLQEMQICFIEEQDIKELLSGFSSFAYGYMERSPLGQPDQRVCHYFYEAMA